MLAAPGHVLGADLLAGGPGRVVEAGVAARLERVDRGGDRVRGGSGRPARRSARPAAARCGSPGRRARWRTPTRRPGPRRRAASSASSAAALVRSSRVLPVPGTWPPIEPEVSKTSSRLVGRVTAVQEAAACCTDSGSRMARGSAVIFASHAVGRDQGRAGRPVAVAEAGVEEGRPCPRARGRRSGTRWPPPAAGGPPTRPAAPGTGSRPRPCRPAGRRRPAGPSAGSGCSSSTSCSSAGNAET